MWLCIRYYPLHAEHIFRKVSSWKDLKACYFSLVLYKGTWPFSDPNFSSFPPPSTLPPASYLLNRNGPFLSVRPVPLPPPRPFFKILSKISDQRQRWCKLKSRLPRYFIRNLLFFRAILLCKTRSCVYCRALACAGRSRLAHFTELAPQNPSQRTNHCSSCLPQRWDPRRSTSIQRNSAFL